ncbi:MAG TPA: hypothetical protein VIB99_08760, partial [Candidatus Limnocylindrales bacterium]
AAVERVIRSAAGDLLRNVQLFDVYRGTPLLASEQSLAWRLIFQADDRTLTDGEIETSLAAVATGLANEVGGRIRS